MEKHYGQILEHVIRSNGFNISELSRLLNVNRRSIYNWFNMPRIRPEIIFKIGCALRYDFSKEFPELFRPEEFSKKICLRNPEKTAALDRSGDRWEHKYIALLEKYNEMLLNQVEQLYSSGVCRSLFNFGVPLIAEFAIHF
ncbi:hypothetical protein JHJ32_19625 [Parapedobacter sp. ISTM3]|uniref:Uncharacterized protein n=1 Tax=Parapedobacter luteus TaxID=623280 RepID=A0A1T5A761_9SPHI|nr:MULTISPECIES: helix-turn-helix domain-containing protein [Parapedobacter]MBK1442216.1 hypothetical protein [Parapedobacter sp. ISTM3]SKB30735.1 hypothetical protein SAMN05660226_00655 [Parapedobacter luteus]